MSKVKERKGLLSKTLERCRSMGGRRGHYRAMKQVVVAPEGYFSVYVGAERERFLVPMEKLNHPMFRVLLDEAKMEYGYKSDGPLELPCDVELFHRVLWEMEDQEAVPASPLCGFAAGRAGYQLLVSYDQRVASGQSWF